MQPLTLDRIRSRRVPGPNDLLISMTVNVELKSISFCISIEDFSSPEIMAVETIKMGKYNKIKNRAGINVSDRIHTPLCDHGHKVLIDS